MRTQREDEVSAGEAALILGVSRDTVQNYRARGILSARGERRGLTTWYWYKRTEVEALAARLAAGEER
jgi:phage terminase Nu1 subunit (DNA packaging protein)